jgi:hypothetical protein
MKIIEKGGVEDNTKQVNSDIFFFFYKIVCNKVNSERAANQQGAQTLPRVEGKI